MIEIKTCPSTLQNGCNTYNPKSIKTLFDGKRVSPIVDFTLDDFRNNGDLMDAMHRISVSGVQEKFPAVVEGGKIRLARKGERSTHILKPAPWDNTLLDRKQIPANEHLTMQIAGQVYGIPTAANGLCFTSKGQPIYITKRFDLNPNGEKITMEDFAAVVSKNEHTGGTYFKYAGCYEDIAVGIRKNIAAWMVDMERFFEMVVFNYIYGNGDAHLKNFSIICGNEGNRLTPAYDLLNTELHIKGDDFGLSGGLSPHIERSDIMDRTGHPCRLDFERFGIVTGMVATRIKRVLDKYMEVPEKTKTLINNSYLNEKMKRSYLRIVEERTHRFIRTSE